MITMGTSIDVAFCCCSFFLAVLDHQMTFLIVQINNRVRYELEYFGEKGYLFAILIYIFLESNHIVVY